jgi:LmbE family N-acetylglucosaminyl deacetylase
MNEILVVAAHPDDEILGCGATLARHAAEGDRVHVLILGRGLAARGAVEASEFEALEAAARAAAKTIGAQPPRFAGLPDNRLDSVDLLDVIKPIEAVLEELRPAVVYTHHGGDLNVDHRVACEAVATACRPVPGGSVRALYGFETLSSTEWGVRSAHAAFRPNHFVAVAEHLPTKLKALSAYETELRSWPHARSLKAVDALARVRGASVGCEAAEAFELLRELR